MAFKNVLVQFDNHRNYESRLRVCDVDLLNSPEWIYVIRVEGTAPSRTTNGDQNADRRDNNSNDYDF